MVSFQKIDNSLRLHFYTFRLFARKYSSVREQPLHAVPSNHDAVIRAQLRRGNSETKVHHIAYFGETVPEKLVAGGATRHHLKEKRKDRKPQYQLPSFLFFLKKKEKF